MAVKNAHLAFQIPAFKKNDRQDGKMPLILRMDMLASPNSSAGLRQVPCKYKFIKKFKYLLKQLFYRKAPATCPGFFHTAPQCEKNESNEARRQGDRVKNTPLIFVEQLSWIALVGRFIPPAGPNPEIPQKSPA